MPYGIYKLDFQEKNLNLDRDLNHGSPDHYPGALNQSSLTSPCSNVPLETIDTKRPHF